jgi:acetylornithine deacetylase
MAGLVLSELDRLDAEELPARPQHALLGRPSVHASLISGGSGMSTYPDRCELRIERRTLPGETPRAVLAEVQAACDRVRARRPEFRADVRVTLAQEPSDVSCSAPVVTTLVEAIRVNGLDVRIEGMSAWTDAALLNGAGIPAICFGPGDMMVAHAAEEFVRVEEIEQATAVLTRLAATWGAD